MPPRMLRTCVISNAQMARSPRPSAQGNWRHRRGRKRPRRARRREAWMPSRNRPHRQGRDSGRPRAMQASTTLYRSERRPGRPAGTTRTCGCSVASFCARSPLRSNAGGHQLRDGTCVGRRRPSQGPAIDRRPGVRAAIRLPAVRRFGAEDAVTATIRRRECGAHARNRSA